MAIKVDSGIRLKGYAIVGDAVDRGVTMGIRRAYKYSDHPTEEAFIDYVTREVLAALDDVLAWE